MIYFLSYKNGATENILICVSIFGYMTAIWQKTENLLICVNIFGYLTDIWPKYIDMY